MIYLDNIIQQLSANAETVRAFLAHISPNQAEWKPDPETWSLKDVMQHFYNEERIDFRMHIKEVFHDPPIPWGEWHDNQYIPVETFQQALDLFLQERAASLDWLRSIQSPDWDVAHKASFGPQNEVIVLRAGDILVSWLAHDFLHIRQLNELNFAWTQSQAAPYSVDYAGGW